MHPSCLEFVTRSLSSNDVTGRRVLEVGAQNVNGSVRTHVEGLSPSQYIGVDITAGPGVDQICSAEELEATFGAGSFDVVVCTEVLEHIENWRAAIRNLKAVTRPGGVIVLTTRAPGFALHGYPSDHWRYNVEDMKRIFGDFLLEAVERDIPSDPGVFVKARRPEDWTEANLDDVRLYAIGRRFRARQITALDRRLVGATMVLQRRLPETAWFGLRFLANLVALPFPEHRRSGAGLMANMHKPY